MKKIFAKVIGTIVMVSMLSTAAISTSCTDYDTDINNLQTQIDNLAERVAKLETDLNALTAMVDGMVLSATPEADGSWTIETADGTFKVTVPAACDCPDEPQLANGGVTVMEIDGVYYWATVVNGEPVALEVDGEMVPVSQECTPEVRQNPATGKTEMSLDGENWIEIGYVFEAITVENGQLIVTVAGQTVAIDLAVEVAFEAKNGRVIFNASETKELTLKAKKIEGMFLLGQPEGWSFELTEEGVRVTAPEENPNYYGWGSPVIGDQSGYVKVAGIAENGKTIIANLSVSVQLYEFTVSAYSGKAMINFNDPNGDIYSYYYGAMKKSEYESEMPKILNALYMYYEDEIAELNEATESVEASIAELLGYEPVVGEEYVVWAWADDYYGANYTMDEVLYATYSPVKVETEILSTAAYEIEVSVKVAGAEGYIMCAMSEDYYIGPDHENASWGTTASRLPENYAYGEIYGKLYTEDYVGSLLAVANGTSYSSTGQEAPGKKAYLMIMPIDGRPADAYTEKDVIIVEGQFNDVTVGGDLTLTTEQIFEYKDYAGNPKEVNQYTEIYLNVTPSEGWYALYNVMMSPDDLLLYADDESLAKDIVEKNYPMYASDQVDATTLQIPFTDLTHGTTYSYVAILVNAEGQYKEVYKQDYSTKSLEYSKTLTLNVTGEEFLDTQTQTINVEVTGGTAAKYRYVNFESSNSTWKWTFEEDPAKVEFALITNDFGYSNPSVELESIPEGGIKFENLKWDMGYHFFIIGIDEEGLTTEAHYIEYTPLWDCGDIVMKSDASWAAVQPEVEWTYKPNGNYMDITLSVKRVEGTTVAVFAQNPASYMEGVDTTDAKAMAKQIFVTLSNYYRDIISEGQIDSYYGNYWGGTRISNGVYTLTEDENGWAKMTKPYTYRPKDTKIIYMVIDAEGKYYEHQIFDVTEGTLVE